MQNLQQNFQRIRQNFVIEMRKQARSDIFMKRRKIVMNSQSVVNHNEIDKSTIYIVDERFRCIITEFNLQNFQIDQIEELCEGLQVQDATTRHRSVIGLRKLISQEKNQEVIQCIIDSGSVPLLIALMKQSSFLQIQLESCWIVTNIASGSSFQTASIVQKNCIDIYLQLLYENRPGISQQALWGLGNIAGDCPKYRDLILVKGGLQCLIRIVSNSQNKMIIRQGAWAIANLCRGAPLPRYQLIKPAIPFLCKLILNEDINEGTELTDALWAISQHGYSQKSKIQRLVEINGFVAKLIQLCYRQTPVIVPTLKIIGNITTGNESQTEQILVNNGFSLLEHLLENQKKSIRRQACWIISNIAAGSKKQIIQLMSRKPLLSKLTCLLTHDNIDIKRQICFIFGNASQLGDITTVYSVIGEFNIIEGVAALIFQNEDSRTLQVALKTVYDILCLGERLNGENPICVELGKIQGFSQRLEQLQHHEQMQIYKHTIKILQRFYTLEDYSF